MSAQRHFYGLVALAAAYVAATLIAYMASMLSSSGVFALLCSLAGAVTLFAVFTYHSRTRSAICMRHLLSSIHAQVSFLTDIGCSILIPHESRHGILHLLVRIEEDSAIVEEVGRNDIYYRYSIQEIGRVRRSMAGSVLTDADYRWRDDELTPARLQTLLAALRGAHMSGQVLAAP